MNLPSPNHFRNAFNDAVWLDAARCVCADHKIAFESLARAPIGDNVVVFIDDRFVLKIFEPGTNGFTREKAALEFVQNRLSLETPEIVACGKLDGYEYLLTTLLAGRSMNRAEWLKLSRSVQLRLITKLASVLREMHGIDAREVDFDWHHFLQNQVETVVERQRREGGNPEWIESLPRYLDDYLGLLPARPAEVFVHGDVHFGNVHVSGGVDDLMLSGLFDFADSLKGFCEYDFAAIGVLMIQGQGDLQREFFRAYGYADSEINIELRRRMMLMTILYEYSSLKRYADRLRPGAVELTLDELEREIWNFV